MNNFGSIEWIKNAEKGRKKVAKKPHDRYSSGNLNSKAFELLRKNHGNSRRTS
jgi:hypothetical protein